jgi:hypothetical protein
MHGVNLLVVGMLTNGQDANCGNAITRLATFAGTTGGDMDVRGGSKIEDATVKPVPCWRR